MDNSNRASVKRHRFKPSELSDRIMGLNRMEQKNLDNRIRAIEKENRVKMSFINRDIKQLEYEADVHKKLVEGFNHDAKIKFLNAHLHMVLLNQRKLEYEMEKFKMSQDLMQGEEPKETLNVQLPKIESTPSSPTSPKANKTLDRSARASFFRSQSARPVLQRQKQIELDDSELCIIQVESNNNSKNSNMHSSNHIQVQDPLKLIDNKRYRKLRPMLKKQSETLKASMDSAYCSDESDSKKLPELAPTLVT